MGVKVLLIEGISIIYFHEGSCSDILLESDVLAFCSRAGIEIRFNTVLLTYDPEEDT